MPATSLPALVLRLGLAYECEEPNTWLILAIFVGFLTGGIALRWVLMRRWRLTGREAPPLATLDRAERLWRSGLRATLGFDAMVVVPAAGLLLANATRDTCAPSHSETTGVLVALAFFFLPVPLLLAKVRALERVRIDNGRR